MDRSSVRGVPWQVRFETPIPHPNVDAHGSPCLADVAEWQARFTVKEVRHCDAGRTRRRPAAMVGKRADGPIV
jgi:hypothetical protein